MSRRHKFKALTWRERALFFQACAMLPATALGVRLLGVKRSQNALGYLGGSPTPGSPARQPRWGGTVREGSPTWDTSPKKNSAARTFVSAVSSVPPSEVETQTARRIARLVRAAANHGAYRANCLQQSLVLWWLLRRAGLKSDIRFGARKEEDHLHAHAWVECLGVALNEDRGVEERYSPFSEARTINPLESQ